MWKYQQIKSALLNVLLYNMFTLKGKQDGFRLLLPDDFICEEINEKYTNILKARHSFITKPIDFLNETIQSVQVLGFTEGTLQQTQSGVGAQFIKNMINRTPQNEFRHTSTDVNYRSEVNPLQLIDKTLNINFRHTLGYVNYFLIFENFFYQYTRDRKYEELPYNFNVDIFNERGEIYSKIVLMHPLVNGIDMLDLNYTQPIAQSQTFKVEFKYTNLDYQFIEPGQESEVLELEQK